MWRNIGASRWVLDVITDGLRLPWTEEPPRWRPPPLPLAQDVLQWSQAEVARWCSRGFARRATAAEARTARWVSTSFVVNITSKPRLVIDYKHQNTFLEDRPFKYEQMADFVMDLRLNDHMTSWDVADAFHHVLLAGEESYLLGFRVGSVVYFPLTMPFGLKLAPWVWTKLLRPVVAYLRQRGFKILAYMDDFGCLGGLDPGPRPVSASRATAGRAEAVAIFGKLGLDVHLHKGAQAGTQRLDLLGFTIDTNRRLLLLPPARLRAVVGAAISLRRHAATHSRWVTLRALQRYCGTAVSTSAAVPDARFRLQALYACFPAGPRRGQRQLSRRAMADLAWWGSLATSPDVGRALWQMPVLGEFTTDACGYGWGGLLNRTVPARGFFSMTHMPAHINIKELLAMLFTLRSFPRLRGPGVVRFRVDSLVNVHVVNTMRSRSPALMEVLRELQWELHRRSCARRRTGCRRSPMRTRTASLATATRPTGGCVVQSSSPSTPAGAR